MESPLDVPIRGKSIRRSNKVETQFIKINGHHYIEQNNYIELFVTVINKSDRDEFLDSVVDGKPFNVVFIKPDATMIQVAGMGYSDPVDFVTEADFYY